MTSGTAVANREAGAWRPLMKKWRQAYTNLWSATTFATDTMVMYAEEIIVQETRRGIRLIALLCLLIQLIAIFFQLTMGHQAHYVYTCAMLALLSLFVYGSARLVGEIRLLYLLGVLLLIISAGAIMFLARANGSLSPMLMASLVLLFMAMPLVPWGLREATSVVMLTYVLLILSMISLPGQFDRQTLVTLQFLTFAAATVAGILIARNVYVRKGDLRTRYGLETAQKQLRKISLQDPLTGAWNRRFMDENFADIAKSARQENLPLTLALLDIDAFKRINDNYGHDHGDAVLRCLASIFMQNRPDTCYLVRLGGDEFALIYVGDGCEPFVRACLARLEADLTRRLVAGGEPVTVSVGFAALMPADQTDLTALYRIADQDLYAAKHRIFDNPDQDRRRDTGLRPESNERSVKNGPPSE